MRKNIILSLTVGGALLSLGALWTGCDDDGGGTTIPPKMDMAMPIDTDSGVGPDMTPEKDCVDSPASNDDFLNSCAAETVVGVELDPQFPAKAPAGVLPNLP